MRCKSFLLMLLVATLFTSCEVKMPEDVIPQGKMEALLYDYHLAQSMSSEYTSADYKEKLFFTYLFSLHGVTQEQFERSMEWYNRYPKHLQRMYANLEKRLEVEVEKMNNAGGAMEEGVNLEAAYLAADTADLWTGSRNKMLACSMLDSHVSFGFDVPDDSTFVAGDSISLSFNAMFVTAGVKDVRQLAHAALLLGYEDGSVDSKGFDVVENGEYILALERNGDSRLESVSGFVYYFDNDTTAAAKLLLNDISLTRIHPQKSEKEEE